MFFFSAQFVGVVSHYGKIDCSIGVLQRAACLVVGTVTVGSFAFLFGCVPVGSASDSVAVLSSRLVYWWDGGGLVLRLFVGPAVLLPVGFLLLQCLVLFAVWVVVFALSPFCVLVCMFLGMVHLWVGGLSCGPDICLSWSASGFGVGLVLLGPFCPFSKSIFFTGHSRAMLLLWIVFVSYASCWCVLCCDVCSLVALWSTAGKGLTSWLICLLCLTLSQICPGPHRN